MSIRHIGERMTMGYCTLWKMETSEGYPSCLAGQCNVDDCSFFQEKSEI